MAFGFIKILPASGHTELALSGTGGGNQYPSVKVLNPNDGVVYVARNRDCLSVNLGDWEWKVPSQSYAILPGPFTGVGMFYLDQSGAGRQGEITVYASQDKVNDPVFLAIGRALQAQATALDIVEGTLPGNPGASIARLWASATDFLHILNGAGVDATVIDSLTPLGGVLSGTLPSPGLAVASVITASLAAGAVSNILSVGVNGSFSTTSGVEGAIPGCNINPFAASGGTIIALGWVHGTHNTANSRIASFLSINDGGGGHSWSNFEQRFTSTTGTNEGSMFHLVIAAGGAARGDWNSGMNFRVVEAGTATVFSAGYVLVELKR